MRLKTPCRLADGRPDQRTCQLKRCSVGTLRRQLQSSQASVQHKHHLSGSLTMGKRCPGGSCGAL